MRAVNWFGLAGGAATLLLAAASLQSPWWILTVGEGLFVIQASPLNVRFYLLGNSFTLPVLQAFTLIFTLALLAGGAALLVYSIHPRKPYSDKLLGFGYKKPIYVLALFLAGIVLLTTAPKVLLGVSLPLHGTASVNLPQGLVAGARVKVIVSASFQQIFWLAVTTVALCIAARIYHRKLLKVST